MSQTSRVLNLARNRRPVRSFADRPLPGQAVRCILEAARYAPSAKEAQPWRLVAVREALARHQLARAAFNHPHLRQAPLVVVCCARVHSHVSGTGRPSYPVDLASAVQTMVLTAADLGLATSWITGFREGVVREELEAPDDVPVVAMLAVGYPDGLEPLPERRPVEEVVSLERWDGEAP